MSSESCKKPTYLQHFNLPQSDLLDQGIVVGGGEAFDCHHVARLSVETLEDHAVGAFADLGQLLIPVEEEMTAEAQGS